MVAFAQSRCKWSSVAPGNGNSENNSVASVKAKGRKTLPAVMHVDPVDKLPSVDCEKLSLIEKYTAAVRHVVKTARDKYVSSLTDLVVNAVEQSGNIELSLNESITSQGSLFLQVFAVRVPPAISDIALAYSQIFSQLISSSEKSGSVIVRLKTLHTETLQLMFAEILKKIAQGADEAFPNCSFELLLKLLKSRSTENARLILLFENAEKIPIGVLSTAMQLFGQSFTAGGMKPVFILGVSSAESWHKMHSSLPLRASKNVNFCFLSADASAGSQKLSNERAVFGDVDFVENILQELLLSERFPLKLGPMCAAEVLTWLRDGRLTIATCEKLFHFIAQCQLYKIMAEDGDFLIKTLAGSKEFENITTASSRQRSVEVNVRGCLSRLQAYWIDVKAACLVLRQIEETVLACSFQSSQNLSSILDMLRITLEANIAQTRWCNRLLMGIGTLSESDLDKLLAKLIAILNTVKEETGCLHKPEDQRPNFLQLLDVCIDMRHLYEVSQNKKNDPVTFAKPAPMAFATPSASKAAGSDRRKTIGLFGTPQTSSMSYFEHQARLRAEIKANKGMDEDSTQQQSVSTPGSSMKFGTRQFANQLRDWLTDWVPSKSKIVNSEQSTVFYFDDLWHLSNSFDPDMNELLSAGLSSKSIRQHLTLKVPAQSDFDVHVLFSVFTSSSSAGTIPTTAALNQWYVAFSEARRLRRRKTDPPIDDKEMQARFVSALDELETRGLLRYNPPRRTITKLFECEEDDEL